MPEISRAFDPSNIIRAAHRRGDRCSERVDSTGRSRLGTGSKSGWSTRWTPIIQCTTSSPLGPNDGRWSVEFRLRCVRLGLREQSPVHQQPFASFELGHWQTDHRRGHIWRPELHKVRSAYDRGLFKAWEIRGARHAHRVVIPRSRSAAFSSNLQRDLLAGHILRDLVVCRYQEQDLIFRDSITDDYRPRTAAADVSQFSLGMVVEPDSTFPVRHATGTIDIRLPAVGALNLCH